VNEMAQGRLYFSVRGDLQWRIWKEEPHIGLR